jgi:hypothetical protein
MEFISGESRDQSIMLADRVEDYADGNNAVG